MLLVGGDSPVQWQPGSSNNDGLWALDPALAHARHFPAVDWKRSYSLYLDALDGWFRANAGDRWPELRRELMALLQREEQLQEIVQMVGIDALQDPERVLLSVSGMVREEFLRQTLGHQSVH